MAAGPKKFKFEAGKEDAGKRLDQVLAAHVPGLSRRKARVLLDIGGVFVEGARVKVAGKTVYAGQFIEAVLGGALDRATGTVGKAARAKDEANLPEFKTVHEDEHIVVVEKPAGLLTAPTPESDRGNLAGLLERKYGEIFVVHRIDLETSGLLVFARTAEANRVLSKMFSEHDLLREYLVIVQGAWPDAARTVEHPVNEKRAVTHFTVERRFAVPAVATEVRARLETGRTHQIRIHCRVRGFPVAGDRVHGTPDPNLAPPRMALHAAKLGIRHPISNADLLFESPWPDDLAKWIAGLTPV